MRAHIVSAKDYRDAIRSQTLYALTGLLGAFVVIMYGGLWYVDAGIDPSEIAELLALPLQVIVPLLGLIVGYMAVVGERRSGSLKILLGLPPTRADVVFGKLLGRLAVVGTAILVAVVTAAVLSAVLFGGVPVVELAALFVVTTVLGAAFVGIAVGCSAGLLTRGRTMAAVVGMYILFLGFWDAAIGGFYRLLMGRYPPNPFVSEQTIEPWVVLLSRLNPMEAYGIIGSSLLDQDIFPLILQFPIGVPTISPDQYENALSGDVPFYLSDWFAGVILLGWILLPVIIGYLRFERTDLS